MLPKFMAVIFQEHLTFSFTSLANGTAFILIAHTQIPFEINKFRTNIYAIFFFFML